MEKWEHTNERRLRYVVDQLLVRSQLCDRVWCGRVGIWFRVIYPDHSHTSHHITLHSDSSHFTPKRHNKHTPNDDLHSSKPAALITTLSSSFVCRHTNTCVSQTKEELNVVMSVVVVHRGISKVKEIAKILVIDCPFHMAHKTAKTATGSRETNPIFAYFLRFIFPTFYFSYDLNSTRKSKTAAN